LVTIDASDYAIGAVLSQGPVGQDRLISYASRILCKAEQNYNITEKELLTIVWAVKYFRFFIRYYNSVSQGNEEEGKKKKHGNILRMKNIKYEYHDASIGGHQGITRTLSRIKLEHNWRGITRDIEEYISKYEYCQKNKLSRKTKMPLTITDTLTRPFEKCALDIVGHLTVTTNGNKYILTFQDNLTKFSKAIPLTN